MIRLRMNQSQTRIKSRSERESFTPVILEEILDDEEDEIEEDEVPNWFPPEFTLTIPG